MLSSLTLFMFLFLLLPVAFSLMDDKEGERKEGRKKEYEVVQEIGSIEIQ